MPGAEGRSPLREGFFWWSDVLYPLLLLAALFLSLTYLTYQGEPHRRIAGQFGRSLLEFTLSAAGARPARYPEATRLVTLSPGDAARLPVTEYEGYRDAAIPVYAALLDRLLGAQAGRITVQWMPHWQRPGQDFTPLWRVLRRYQAERPQVIFTVPPDRLKELPPPLFRLARVVESDPCQRWMQTLCPFDSQWDKWVVQLIPNLFWRERRSDARGISTNLPERHASYILHLSRREQLTGYSFADVLGPHLDPGELTGRHIFVGSDLRQKAAVGDGPDQLGRVATPLDGPGVLPEGGGTPLHVFWAQLAQLFIDDALVEIVPARVSIAVAILFALVITLILLAFGPPAALGFFLLAAVAAPLCVSMGVRFGGVYLPLFDSYYAGVTALVAATFARLSFETFQNWRMRMRERHEQEVAESKSHFLSLISHNLNTPVAKMQGMLDLLRQHSPSPGLKDDAALALRRVAQIQLCIRAVLTTTSIEEGQLQPEPVTTRQLIRDIEDDFRGPLQRLGVGLDLAAAAGDNEADLPLRLNRRAVGAVVASLSVLLGQEGSRSAEVRLAPHPEAHGGNGIAISARGKRWFHPAIARRLETVDAAPDMGIWGASLLEDLAAKLIAAALRSYRGEIVTDASNRTLQLRILSETAAEKKYGAPAPARLQEEALR